MRKLLLISLLFSLTAQGQTPMKWLTKRASSSNPASISGLIFWVKADQLEYADGDPVDAWDDQSGTNHGLTQTGSNRPIYKTGILNSLPVVRFDGSNDYFNLTTSFASGSDNTFFIVYKKRVTAAKIATLGSFGNSSPYTILDYSDDNIYMWNTGDGYYYGTGGYYSSFVVLSETNTGGTATVYVNGSSVSLTSGGGTGASNNFDVFGVRNADYADGDIAEVCFYNRALNSTERAIVTTYLQTKYGL